MKTLKLKCEILSPLHIGTGDEIEPLDYFIEERKLHRVSFAKLVAGLDEAQRVTLEHLIDKGELAEIRRYITENMTSELGSFYSVDVSPGVQHLYDAKMGDIRNQLLINPFIRAEYEPKPLIPGSTIKGAIRTAIVSELAKKSKLPKPKNYKEEYAFESKVLGYRDAKYDPFRGMKIRDKSLTEDSTIIREIRNVSKKSGDILQSNNIQIICEVSHSAITGKYVNFETELFLDEVLFSTNLLSKTLTADQIVKSCTAFYRNKMEDEHKKFYQGTEVESSSMQLLNTSLDDNSFLLRIGRFSGVESVTLDRYRNPKPPGNKTVWGTTRNLVEAMYPIGWVKVAIYS